MQVALLDYTGIGQPDPAAYAAKLLIYAKSTRLTQGETLVLKIEEMTESEVAKAIEDIAISVKSSHEFVNYTFQVTGVTRAFTHQFVRSRHASFAQQAMRVADMGNFETLVPQSVKAEECEEEWKDLMELTQDVYKKMRDSGVPAQDARGILPTNVLTNIMAQFNLRALSELAGKRINLRAQDEYVETLTKMIDCVLDVHPFARAFIYPERTATPALDRLLKAQLDGRSPVDVPEVNQALKELDRLRASWG